VGKPDKKMSWVKSPFKDQEVYNAGYQAACDDWNDWLESEKRQVKEGHCELCGTPVKVVGHTTLHYEPIPIDEHDMMILLRKTYIEMTGEKLEQDVAFEMAIAVRKFIERGKA